MVFEVLAWLSLVVIGTRLSAIDIAEHRLPNRLMLALAILSTGFLAAAALSNGDPTRLLRALASGGLVFAALLALAIVLPSGLGMGDAKLGFVTGLFLGWLGWEWVYWGTLLAFALGASCAVFRAASRRASLSTAIAFGPLMLAGVLICAVAATV